MTQWLVDTLARLAGALMDASIAHPKVALSVVAGLVLFFVIRRWSKGRRERKHPNVAKDPVRMFTSEERAEGFGRTGGRCEFDGWLFKLNRCHRPAAHGDHWQPWARGGATTMDNFVSACVRCNTSKGAKIPTWGQTVRVAWRRRFYFPKGSQRRPGETFTG